MLYIFLHGTVVLHYYYSLSILRLEMTLELVDGWERQPSTGSICLSKKHQHGNPIAIPIQTFDMRRSASLIRSLSRLALRYRAAAMFFRMRRCSLSSGERDLARAFAL